MSDSSRQHGAFPRPQVALRAADEISYWCVMLNCNEAELREAVNAVGVAAIAIERYLDVKKTPSLAGRTGR